MTRNLFPKGCRVRYQRDAPAKGCWADFDGRIGTVTVPDNLGEVGVVFDDPKNHSPALWFLPTELVRVKP